jgi:anti-sigma regulatory factor (Ser/Thr protein kinase)
MAGVTQVLVPVEDLSQVAEARRQAHIIAVEIGFDVESSGKLAVAVTEAATNILKHAGSGRILLRTLVSEQSRGLEVLAVDRGPGIRNLAASMQDGFSTAGSPGTGLGAISRMASELDIYSRAGQGTVLRFEVWPRAGRGAGSRLQIGAITAAKRGEPVCGDAWAVKGYGYRYTVMVVDGLGHGPEAAAAAQAALDALARSEDSAPAAVIIDAAHAALLSTRGAAAAVATLDLSTGSGQYCGVGNISGIVYLHNRPRHLVSHNGTLGHNARKIQPFDFEFPAGALLIMFSDGLISHWTLDDYPGLLAKHPALIAAILHRDYDRGRDDVSITVIRHAAV